MTDYIEFKLPIQYVNHKILPDTIINDLDMLNEHLDTKPLLKYFLNPTTLLGDNIIKQSSKYYTTNTKFLNQTKKIIKKIPLDLINRDLVGSIETFQDKWNEFKSETSFCEKYLYIDWDPLKFLNNNSEFLQINAIYNLSSPLLSLIMPIFMLILPFVILKIKGVSLSINEYLNILKTIANNHALIKLFTNYSELNNSQTLYSIVTLFFYFFSIYQSILYSIRFYTILNKINNFYSLLNNFTLQGINSIKWFTENVKCNEYKYFLNDIQKLSVQLQYIKTKISNFNSLDINFRSIFDLGKKWQLFYELFNNKSITNSIENTLCFLGYVDTIIGIKSNVVKGHLNPCKFTKNKTNIGIEKQYYPSLMNENHVTNSLNLNTNMIISGPNASGKTTILKTTLLNLIFSQTYGYGCFKKATIKPYDIFNSYLNIPDTSGRDSLFQAEAKRCKDIIDSVKKYRNKQHFCIIDELYSGTNPIEATNSCIGFMKYMSKKTNINIFLTTHYLELCETLNDCDNIVNYSMKTSINDNRIVFHYKLEKGISNIQGAKFILDDLKYPIDIFE
jgi:hypothetical protein